MHPPIAVEDDHLPLLSNKGEECGVLQQAGECNFFFYSSKCKGAGKMGVGRAATGLHSPPPHTHLGPSCCEEVALAAPLKQDLAVPQHVAGHTKEFFLWFVLEVMQVR